MKTRILSLFFVAVFAIGMTGCEKVEKIKKNLSGEAGSAKTTQTSPDKPMAMKPDVVMKADSVAKVGDWIFSKDDFEDRLDALEEAIPDFDPEDMETKKLILEELVRQQLLVKYAEESGIADKKEIVDAVDEFKKTLYVREVAQSLTEDLEVTDEEAREFYDKNAQALIEPVEVKVREIVVDSQEKANNILIELLKGADFAEQARLNSKSETASKGGDLGFINQVPFPEMGSAIMSLEVGGVSSIFKGPDGFYIVKLEEKKGGEQIPFDEIEEDIIQNLTGVKQQQTILNKIEELRSKYDVQVNENLL